MQIEAIYDHGRLEFTRPIRFKSERVSLLVEVSDDDIVTLDKYDLPDEVIEKAAHMRKRLNEARNAPLAPDEQLPPISGKRQERIKAFALREDR